jgi:hypothetical protein
VEAGYYLFNIPESFLSISARFVLFYDKITEIRTNLKQVKFME